MAAGIIGTGTSITFDTGFFAQILGVQQVDHGQKIIPTTHMGTTGSNTYTVGSLIEPGALNVRLYFDAAEVPNFAGGFQSCTVTFSDSSTLAASAALEAYGFDAQTEELIVADARLKLSGNITRA